MECKPVEMQFYFEEGDEGYFCFHYDCLEHMTDCSLPEELEDKKAQVIDSIFGRYNFGGNRFYEPGVMENCDEIFTLEAAIKLAKAYETQGWKLDREHNDISEIELALEQ